MNYLFEDIAEITQGSILTRIKTKSNDYFEVEAISMQELSFYCNESDIRPTKNLIKIDKNKFKNCLFTKIGDVLIGLSSGNSMVIDKERSEKLILSNFAVIRNLKNFNPYYLCRLLNNSKVLKKQISELSQKTSRVSIIPVSGLKKISIPGCEIDEQEKIGKIYDLVRRLLRLRREKNQLKLKNINFYLNKSN